MNNVIKVKARVYDNDVNETMDEIVEFSIHEDLLEGNSLSLLFKGHLLMIPLLPILAEMEKLK